MHDTGSNPHWDGLDLGPRLVMCQPTLVPVLSLLFLTSGMCPSLADSSVEKNRRRCSGDVVRLNVLQKVSNDLFQH